MIVTLLLSLFLGTASGESKSVNVEQQAQVTTSSFRPIIRPIITDDTGG